MRRRNRKNVFAINWMEVEALVKGTHSDPHHILGAHECIDDVYVNVYLPDAKIVRVRIWIQVSITALCPIGFPDFSLQ